MFISEYLNIKFLKSINMQSFFPGDFILLSQFHFFIILKFL